jgi:hypothetical protein
MTEVMMRDDENHEPLLIRSFVSQLMVGSFVYKFIHMLATTYAHNKTGTVPKHGILSRFYTWCDQQNEYRLFWLGFIITSHGCVFTPFSLLSIFALGYQFPLLIVVIAAMGMTLVQTWQLCQHALPFLSLRSA